MYAKVFQQIFDSSIVESPETRFTFMDFLILADCNGVVDMTHEAISRRTNRPLELIRNTIAELEEADARSRTKTLNGARIRRLDKHRDWGWEIVNYRYFRKLASEEQRREKTKARTRSYRQRKDSSEGGDASVTHCDAPKRIGDDSPYASTSSSLSVFPSEFQKEWENFKKHRRVIRHPMSARAEELMLAKLEKRPQDAVSGLQMAMENNWRGFEWKWFDDRKAEHSHNGKPERSMSAFEIEKRVQACNDEINRLYRQDKEGNKPKIEELKTTRSKLKEQLLTA